MFVDNFEDMFEGLGLFKRSMGRSLHYKVEQPHVNTLHVKNPTFYIKHHQNGSKFYPFFS